MPWTVSDVDSHKKGLSPTDKKKWVSIANAILRDCLAKGGTDATCAPKAIKIANSKFSEETMKKEIKLTKSAMCFAQGEGSVKLEQFEEGKIRKITMTAYSGQIIKNHWYWGDLAIDTNGMSMGKEVIPILQDHETDKKIGFGSFMVNDKHEIVPKETSFVDTPFADEFIKLSDQGFPYEASIQARPTKIVRLEEGEETEVNGFTMKGPGTVWRESVLRECSVTTFGADRNTKSVAMTENEDIEVEVVAPKKIEKEVSTMTLAELKAAHPELFAEISALGKAEAEVAFAEIKKGLDAEIVGLKADKESLTTKLSETDIRVLRLEKESSLQKEAGIKASAEVVFSDLMVKHQIPERLRPKIRKLINHESFVADEVLDTTKFAEAIETELKDWVSEGEDDSSILGMAHIRRVDNSAVSEDTMVTRMLGHAGQVTKQ